MALEGRAKRVRIYVNEGDRVGDQSAATAVLGFLQTSAAGAAVFRAVEGFGGHGEIDAARPADTGQAPPMVIEWIDSEERVDRLLPRVKELVARARTPSWWLTKSNSISKISAPIGIGDVLSPRAVT